PVLTIVSTAALHYVFLAASPRMVIRVGGHQGSPAVSVRSTSNSDCKLNGLASVAVGQTRSLRPISHEVWECAEHLILPYADVLWAHQPVVKDGFGDKPTGLGKLVQAVA